MPLIRLIAPLASAAFPRNINVFLLGWLAMMLTLGGESIVWGQDSLWQSRKQGVDWPTFLGVNQDGMSSETGILKDWSGSKLPVAWKIETGEGYSIGSVALGRYVHFDRAKNRARVRCFNAETGRQLWSYQYDSEYSDIYGYDSGPRTSPVIDGNRVYTLGVEGRLTCLSLNDGKEIWAKNTSESFGVIQNFFGVGSTPVVAGNRLLVMVGGSPDESKKVAPGQLNLVKPNGSAIVALDKMSGNVLYKLGNDLASYSTIKLTNDLGPKPLALAFCREQLIVFDPESGKELDSIPWRARMLESVNASTPIVVDGNIFISECYGPGSTLLQWNNQRLSPLWSDDQRRDKTLLAHWNTPVVHGRFGFASSGRNSGDAELKCFEVATGTVQWAKKGLARSSLTLIDDHLIVLGEYGKLLLIRASPKKFDLVTELDFPNHESQPKLAHPCWSAPIVSHGLLIVRGKRQVVCFELIPNPNE